MTEDKKFQLELAETIGPHDGYLPMDMSGGAMVKSIGEDSNRMER